MVVKMGGVLLLLLLATTAAASRYGRLYGATLYINHERTRLVLETNHALSVLMSGDDPDARESHPINVTVAGETITTHTIHLNDPAITLAELLEYVPGLFVKPTAVASWERTTPDYAIPAVYRFVEPEWTPPHSPRVFETVPRENACFAASASAVLLVGAACQDVVAVDRASLIIGPETITAIENHTTYPELHANSVHLGALLLVIFYAMHLQSNMRPTGGMVLAMELGAAAVTAAWLYKEGFVVAERDIRHTEAALFGAPDAVDPVVALIARMGLAIAATVFAELSDPTNCLEVVKRRLLLFVAIQASSIPFGQAGYGNMQSTFMPLFVFGIALANAGSAVRAASDGLIQCCVPYQGSVLHVSVCRTQVCQHVAVLLLTIAAYVATVATATLSGLHIFLLHQQLALPIADNIYAAVVVVHAGVVVFGIHHGWRKTHTIVDYEKNRGRRALHALLIEPPGRGRQAPQAKHAKARAAHKL